VRSESDAGGAVESIWRPFPLSSLSTILRATVWKGRRESEVGRRGGLGVGDHRPTFNTPGSHLTPADTHLCITIVKSVERVEVSEESKSKR
jgi:hypothetical protein